MLSIQNFQIINYILFAAFVDIPYMEIFMITVKDIILESDGDITTFKRHGGCKSKKWHLTINQTSNFHRYKVIIKFLYSLLSIYWKIMKFHHRIDFGGSMILTLNEKFHRCLTVCGNISFVEWFWIFHMYIISKRFFFK